MSAVAHLSWDGVVARRLERHALAAPVPAERIADVVAGIGGAHAQVITAAELSIGTRVAGITRARVREALWVERDLVKTRGPRGTVHLLATRDLPMWTGALTALPREPNRFPESMRMTPAQTDAVVEAIGDALDGAELIVEELTEAIVERVGAWAGDLVMEAFQGNWPRWRQVEDVAANRGALCFGANRGRRVTYTSPRRWLPGFEPLEGEAALAGVVECYLRAYGPATPAHFARWLAMPPGWAARLFERLAGRIERVEVDGDPAWVVAGDTEAPAEPPEGVRLLPYFDAYSVGSHPRERVFPGRAAERALAGSQAGNFPVLLVDGTVAGVWHQRRSGRFLDLTVEPLAPLSAPRLAALDEQVARVGEILEGTPRLTIGPVAVGPHA